MCTPNPDPSTTDAPTAAARATPPPTPPCDICHAPLDQTWTVMALPCTHQYDLTCVAPRLCATALASCPVCTTKIATLWADYGTRASTLLPALPRLLYAPRSTSDAQLIFQLAHARCDAALLPLERARYNCDKAVERYGLHGTVAIARHCAEEAVRRGLAGVDWQAEIDRMPRGWLDAVTTEAREAEMVGIVLQEEPHEPKPIGWNAAVHPDPVVLRIVSRSTSTEDGAIGRAWKARREKEQRERLRRQQEVLRRKEAGEPDLDDLEDEARTGSKDEWSWDADGS